MEYSSSDKSVKKTNLFIVGAAKAGTTSLYNYLNAHREVYMSPLKEPAFFSTDIKWSEFRESYKRSMPFVIEDYLKQNPLPEHHAAYIKNIDDYSALFRDGNNETYYGEASTAYLYSLTAAKEIYRYNPKAKIIILLREPVERTLSHYFMDVSVGRQRENDILKALSKDYEDKPKGWGISNLYIDLSLYHDQIKRYLNVFPKDQVLILNFSDLKKNVKEITSKTFEFLDLDPENVNAQDYDKTHNPTRVPKNRIVTSLLQYKNMVPRPLVKFLKKNNKMFFTDRSDTHISAEVKKYINDQVHEDWHRTRDIVESL